MAKKHDLYRSSKDFNNHDGMIIELVLPGGNIDGSTTISPLTDDPNIRNDSAIVVVAAAMSGPTTAPGAATAAK